jgi:hypothetical protein
MVIGTCGHELDDIDGVALAVHGMDRTGVPCVDYISVCERCAEWYRKNNLIIGTLNPTKQGASRCEKEVKDE